MKKVSYRTGISTATGSDKFYSLTITNKESVPRVPLPYMKFEWLTCHIQAFWREFLEGLLHITWLEKETFWTKGQNETKRFKYLRLTRIFIHNRRKGIYIYVVYFF